MKVVPLGDNVIVKRLDAEETSAGGIVLPESAKQKPQEGRVLSVGDGHRLPDGSRIKLSVKEGDRVVFRSYAGNEVGFDGDDLLILSEDDILAVVR